MFFPMFFWTEFWLFLWQLMFAQDHYTSVIQYHSDEWVWNKFGYRKKYVPQTSDVQTNRRTDKVTDRPIYLILGYFLWYHCRVTLCIVHTRTQYSYYVYTKYMIKCVSETFLVLMRVSFYSIMGKEYACFFLF